MIIDDYLSYLSDVRRQSPETLRLREGYIRRLAADVDLESATTAVLRVWIAEHSAGWATPTVNAVISSMRSFYRWAHETGVVATNPTLPIRGLPVPPKPARIASEDQITYGLASPDADVRLFTRLGAECGLRVHEMAKLHTRDRDGEWLTVLGKGGQTRMVHCSPQMVVDLIIRERSQGQGYYFRSTRPEGHVTTEWVRRRLRETTGTNPHSLRHRAGTTVYRKTGNNLRLTQVFLGHRHPQTTAIYVHVERDDLLQASLAARIAA